VDESDLEFDEGRDSMEGLDEVSDSQTLVDDIAESFERELAHTSNDRHRRAKILFEIGQLEEEMREDYRAARQRYREALDAHGTHLPALRALRRVESRVGNTGEAIRLLQQEVALIGNDHERADALVELGRLFELRDEPEQARTTYRRSLELEASNRDAAQALIALFHDDEQWVSLSEMMLRAAATTTDPVRRSLLTAQAGQIREARLDQAGSAEALLATALRQCPGTSELPPTSHDNAVGDDDARDEADPESLTDMEEDDDTVGPPPGGVVGVLGPAAGDLAGLYLRRGRWAELAQLEWNQAQLTDDVETKASRLYRAGRLFAVRVGDTANAEQCLEQAAELNPTDELAIGALLELREQRGDAGTLERTLCEALPRLRTRDQSITALFEVARLRLECLAQTEGAIAALREALELNPHHAPSLRALEDVLVEQNRFDELIEVLRREVERLRDPHARADVYHELGQLVERYLSDPQRAAAMYRTALDLVPGHYPALNALDRLLTAQSAWEELVKLLEDTARTTDDPRRAVVLLRRAAQLAEHQLQFPERAIELGQRLLGIDKDDVDAIASVGRLLEQTGRWKDRIAFLRRQVALAESEEERQALLMTIGTICEVRLDAPEAARDVYREVVNRNAQHRGALRALAQLDRRAGHYENLLETLKLELAAGLSQDEAASLYYRMARVMEDRLGRIDDAVAAYRAALAGSPRYRPAVDALARLLRSTQKWQELANLCEEQAKQGDDLITRAADWFRLGELREDRLDDPKTAKEAYVEALRLVPEFEPARLGILRIMEGQQDWPAVADELAAEAGRSKGARRLIALLRLASLRVLRVNDPRGAVTALAEAVEMAPRDLAVQETLVNLCRAQRFWERLGPAYANLARVMRDPRDAAAVLHRAALDAKLHPSLGDAVNLYRRILHLAPDDHAAMAAVEAESLATGDRQTLYQVTDLLLSVESRAEHQVPLFVRKGMLAHAMGLEGDAREAFRQALKLDNTCLPALRNLAMLAKADGQAQELADLLELEAHGRRDPRARAEALMEAGRIQLKRLNQKEKAAQCFATVLELAPDHRAAFRHLAALLEDGGRWPELVEKLRDYLVTLAEDQEKIDLRLRLARLERDRLQHPEAARRTLNGLLTQAPAHLQALEMQAGLYASLERWREASDLYARTVAAARKNHEAEVAQRARLSLAELRLRRLGEFDEAVETLQEALDLSADNVPALQLLVEAQRRRGDVSATARALNQLASVLPTQERAAVRLELATLLRDQAGDWSGAAAALRQALADAPEDPEPLQRLTEHHSRKKDWTGLVKDLKWVIETVGGDARHTAAIRVELAHTHIEQQNHVAPGVEQLESVLRALPSHPGARFALARRHLLPPGRPDLAEQQYRAVLSEDTWNREALRGLFDILSATPNGERAWPVAMLLGYLGDSEAGQYLARDTLVTLHPLEPAGYHQLVASPVEPEAFCSLLRAVQHALEKVYPPDLERQGAALSDRSTGADNLSPAVAEIANRLGVNGWETYLSHRYRHGCAIEPGDPPKVVVGVGLQNLSVGIRRFEIGRVLGSVVGGSLLFTKVPRREIPPLLSAIVGICVKGYARMGQPQEVADLTRRVSRAVPRKLRKQLDEHARAAASSATPDVDAWTNAASQSCDRCGLLACADIGAALDALRARDDSRTPLPQESPDHRLAALRGFAPAEALANYWLSAKCEKALSRLGSW
jgi:tetratricopeptide (TPR) repeat protein